MIDVDIIDLPGRVLFPDGTERDFTLRCRGDRMEVVIPAAVEFGAALVCHVAGLGIVEGHAGAGTGAGRVLDLRASPAHRARLAARVAWHRRRAAGLDDQRASQRVAASAAAVRVRCASGVEMAGTMIDLSATGAALRVTARPAIGTAVVVGRRRATVVRHLDDGVAVQFALPLRPQDVTPETVL